MPNCYVTDTNNKPVRNGEGEYLLYDENTQKMWYSATPEIPIMEDAPPAASILVDATNQQSTFSESATKYFLDVLLKKKDKLRSTSIKKKTLWTEVVLEMAQMGYIFDVPAIERKFRNMKHQFLQIKDNNTKTGRGRKSWQYYETMEELFERDTCINPVASMSSSMSSPVASTSQQSTSQPEIVVSGYDIIKQINPETTMLPELSSSSELQKAVLKRRLNTQAATNESSCKQVNKRRKKNKEGLEELTAALVENNRIQQERNDLLRLLVNKLGP